ncbi:MAG: hypothetical protein AVDCRST_MAG49-4231, partial [uncultured Thermomicrobiales bacterium]
APPRPRSPHRPAGFGIGRCSSRPRHVAGSVADAGAPEGGCRPRRPPHVLRRPGRLRGRRDAV